MLHLSSALLAAASRTPHAVPAVVAKVAVAVADGDGAAVVAGGGVELEARELIAAERWIIAVDAELRAGPLRQSGLRPLRDGGRMPIAIAVRAIRASRVVAVAIGLGVAALTP